MAGQFSGPQYQVPGRTAASALAELTPYQPTGRTSETFRRVDPAILRSYGGRPTRPIAPMSSGGADSGIAASPQAWTTTPGSFTGGQTPYSSLGTNTGAWTGGAWAQSAPNPTTPEQIAAAPASLRDDVSNAYNRERLMQNQWGPGSGMGQRLPWENQGYGQGFSMPETPSLANVQASWQGAQQWTPGLTGSQLQAFQNQLSQGQPNRMYGRPGLGYFGQPL